MRVGDDVERRKGAERTSNRQHSHQLCWRALLQQQRHCIRRPGRRAPGDLKRHASRNGGSGVEREGVLGADERGEGGGSEAEGCDELHGD